LGSQPEAFGSTEDTVATFYALTAQDVIIGSKSGFSHIAAVYAPRAVIVAPRFTHPYEPEARLVEVEQQLLLAPANASFPVFDEVRLRALVAVRLAERCGDCGNDGGRGGE
jgi:hypothetical protein